MIEIICQYPTQAVMGTASLLGALVYAGFTIYRKRKEKNFEFEFAKLMDTVWQSCVAGSILGLGIGCGYYGIAASFVAGIGIDKICNKLKIKDTELLNLIQLMTKVSKKAK